MGLFDLFKGKNKDGEKKSNAAAKWAEAAGSKRAQAYDRQEALQELVKLGTPEAVEALLKRFTFVVDPSITDQEEKELALDGILKAGKEAIEPVRKFAEKADSLAWPMRILKELFDSDELVEELLRWLAKWDTEYAKFIDPKLQILKGLEDYKHPKIREAVTPFLQDVNEEARFHAVATILAQQDEQALPALLDCFVDEESVRIRTKIADALAQTGWEIPEERREPVRKALPYEYGVDGTGRVKKR